MKEPQLSAVLSHLESQGLMLTPSCVVVALEEQVASLLYPGHVSPHVPSQLPRKWVPLWPA